METWRYASLRSKSSPFNTGWKHGALLFRMLQFHIAFEPFEAYNQPLSSPFLLYQNNLKYVTTWGQLSFPWLRIPWSPVILWCAPPLNNRLILFLLLLLIATLNPHCYYQAYLFSLFSCKFCQQCRVTAETMDPMEGIKWEVWSWNWPQCQWDVSLALYLDLGLLGLTASWWFLRHSYKLGSCFRLRLVSGCQTFKISSCFPKY